MPEKFFNLGEGENIVREIKPKSGLKWYFMLTGVGISVFVLVLLLPSVVVIGVKFATFLKNFGLLFIAVIILSFSLGIAIAILRYNKQFYWLTNKRVVYKRGLIGYRITSIPYERISDIIISRSLLERIFGFGSLHVQTLAGQVSGTHRLGAEGVLLAVPDPEGTQELIFELARQKRKDEGISF